jgi:ribosomal protein L19
MDQVTVPVLLRSEPKEFQPGDEVLLVGRVVEQPRDRLEGYEGDASRVLLFGAAVKPPP